MRFRYRSLYLICVSIQSISHSTAKPCSQFHIPTVQLSSIRFILQTLHYSHKTYIILSSERVTRHYPRFNNAPFLYFKSSSTFDAPYRNPHILNHPDEKSKRILTRICTKLSRDIATFHAKKTIFHSESEVKNSFSSINYCLSTVDQYHYL